MATISCATTLGPVPHDLTGTAFAPPADQVRPARPPHIPSLDGLRAVSFLIVFAAHAGLASRVPGGFGVTVFFFLSGYLITTLLRFERETTGGVGVRQFYMRRALRILPPFYLILGIAAGLTAFGVLPGYLSGRVMLAQTLHVSNYWFVTQGTAGSPLGTVPYWSLAVEEHFYLLFPMLYIGLSRRLSNRGQAKALWALCALVCAWRCYLVFALNVHEARTYMSSDTRFDSILFGCAVAVGMNPVFDRQSGSPRLWKGVLLPAGIALLLLTFLYRAPWFRETIRYSLQGLALTPVFVAAIRFPTWLPFRLLNARPVAFVGVLSYTLYLVHQVVLYGLAVHYPAAGRVQAAVLALMVSFGVAYAVHVAVERPSARLRNRLGRAPAPILATGP